MEFSEKKGVRISELATVFCLFVAFIVLVSIDLVSIVSLLLCAVICLYSRFLVPLPTIQRTNTNKKERREQWVDYSTQ